MGDENRMRQIFANLLTNGIKYAPPGTSVRIDGDSTGHELRVLGVRRRARHRRPTPCRASSTSSTRPDGAEPGAGLGLAVVRELTEAHGGHLEVESSVGEGTRFTVGLPAWEVAL